MNALPTLQNKTFEVAPVGSFGKRNLSWAVYRTGSESPVIVCNTRAEAQREMKKLETWDTTRREAKARETVRRDRRAETTLDMISELKAKLAELEKAIKVDGLAGAPIGTRHKINEAHASLMNLF